jgi:hypothetical protein
LPLLGCARHDWSSKAIQDTWHVPIALMLDGEKWCFIPDSCRILHHSNGHFDSHHLCQVPPCNHQFSTSQTWGHPSWRLGEKHHSLLNHIYEGSEGCLKLLHCELRNNMALYFVVVISHVKRTDNYSQKFGIQLISSSDNWIFGYTYLSLEPEPVDFWPNFTDNWTNLETSLKKILVWAVAVNKNPTD